MKRFSKGLMLLVMLMAALAAAPIARADDSFLGALSKVATREVRKQLRDKRIPFVQGSLEGNFQAVDPETRLQAEVNEFELANDLVTAKVTASGRFKVDGKMKPDAEFSALFDVTFTVAATARFTKENDKYFVEPEIKDLQMSVSVSEISPANLSGGGELLTSLAMAAFNKNKDKVIAEVNKRLGKRPF
jgi:hypothetical protein